MSLPRTASEIFTQHGVEVKAIKYVLRVKSDKDGNRAIVIEELASVSFHLFVTNAMLCSHVSVVVSVSWTF